MCAKHVDKNISNIFSQQANSFENVDILYGLGTTFYNLLLCGTVNTISGNLGLKIFKNFLTWHQPWRHYSLPPPSVHGNLVGNFSGVHTCQTLQTGNFPLWATGPHTVFYKTTKLYSQLYHLCLSSPTFPHNVDTLQRNETKKSQLFIYLSTEFVQQQSTRVHRQAYKISKFAKEGLKYHLARFLETQLFDGFNIFIPRVNINHFNTKI